MTQSPGLALAKQVQSACFADDLPLAPFMEHWTEQQLVAYFESGGAERPAEESHLELGKLPVVNGDLPEPMMEAASFRSLDTDAAHAFAAALTSCRRLRALDLSDNRLLAEGASALAGALGSLPVLELLDLAGTGAGDKGASALALALGGSARLRSLQLMGCFIKSAGGAAIAQAVPTLPSLEDLGLGWNHVCGEAAVALSRAALAAPRLRRLSGVPLGLLARGSLPEVPPRVGRQLTRRPAFGPAEELNLQGHGCGAPGAYALAALLPRLPPLKALCLPYQDLGDEGAVAVASAAVACGLPLTFVMLSRNDVTNEGHARLQQLLPHLDDFHLRTNAGGG